MRHLSLTNIVLLNGAGSVGKSAIAKAFQKIAPQPYLHIEMDVFLKMMPEKYLNHRDGLSFEQYSKAGHILTKANSGKVAEKVLSGMRTSIAALADAGNNLIVDDVLFGNTEDGDGTAFSEYQNLLRDHDLCVVGVFASLDTLEERERARGDRMVGLSRWQFERVHVGMPYNLKVRSDDATPEQCAERILEIQTR